MKSYFTIDELCQSETAEEKNIDNSPSGNIKNNLNRLILFLNPLREKWEDPIRINSGYRCPKLNEALGGSKTSAHMTGNAVDMYPCNNDFEGFKNFILDYLKDKNFDQCIIEKSGNSEWIHFGLYNNKEEQRKMTFNMNV